MKYSWVAAAAIAVLAACSGEKGSSSTESSASAGGKVPDAECVEPENPYNDDGGHDAGFKWAQENGEACNGNSESFNEGCEEYHRQREKYEECEAAKHR